MANECEFGLLFAGPPRNGLTRPKSVRGSGVKMVNMGELFAHARLQDVEMDRVPLSDSEAERFLLKSGDLLFARQSLVLEGAGKSSIFLRDAEPVTFESHVTRVRLDPTKGNPLFYFYYFQSQDGRNVVRSIVEQGAGASGIRGSDLAKLAVVSVPIDVQNSVAQVLGRLDDKIELNRKMNETLEAMAHALFKSWFVDFDPVRAKAEGRDTGLPAHIAALFPDSFDDSELGAIPTGWNTVPLHDIAEFTNGAAYRDMHFSEKNEGLPVVKIAELKSGVTRTTRFTTTNLGEKYRIDSRELLFSWSGNPDTSIDTFIWDGGPAWLNQHIFRVREKRDWSRVRIYLQLRILRPIFAEIARNKQTTGLGHVTIADMKRLFVCRPPSEVAEAFDHYVRPVLERMINNQSENRTLSSLRDSLLPKLISGEVRIAQFEPLVEVYL